MVGKGRTLLALTLVLTLVVLALPLDTFAVSYGHIKGQITNAADKTPVVGANVLVVGTKFGASTDPDGHFQILRVEPGTYTLRISAVGFNTLEVTNVTVKIDETYEVNQTLTASVTDIGTTITVEGVGDLLDKYVVGGQVAISAETIKQRPVQTVDALLTQVAGVQTSSEGEVFIRGGRAGEVAYIVDGVPIGDPLGGRGQIGANLSLTSGSIAEIQIIKDGFDPEYGNALSGIVNIRSLTGDRDVTRLNLQYLTDDFGNQKLNKYSRNYDYVRMALSGPDPILSDKILPAFGLNAMRDQEFTYYLYADVDKNDGIYQMQDYDTPETRRDWPSFNLLGFDVPERLVNRYHFESNFKFRPQQNTKIVFSYKRWYTKQTLFDRDGWAYRYSNSTADVNVQDQTSISLELTQSVSKDMNYEVVVSYYNLESSFKPGDPNNPGKTLDPPDFLLDYEWETYQDRNENGVYDAPEPIINLYPDTTVYGTDYSGPAYTGSEGELWFNEQGGVVVNPNFRFNANDIVDDYEGEPFIDLNGNGVWDQGDYLNDKNGNGVLDDGRVPTVRTAASESFIDGDSILGEPYYDINKNGSYDQGIDQFIISITADNQDLNRNGKYDGPEDTWTPGVPYLDRNGNGVYDPPNNTYDVGEPYTDVNGNGTYDYGGSDTFLENGTYLSTTAWNETRTRTWRGEVKMVRQIGRHELKAGFHLQSDKLEYKDIEKPWIAYNGRADTLNEYSDRGLFRDFYEYEPIQGSVYFRDKIEYGSMIASLGLRWDFFLQDTDKLAANLARDDRGGTIYGDRHKLSPRIGFSYPISDKAKVYFNYGHFYQMPLYRYMYRRNTTTADQNDVLGNPNLTYQKTIQYSFGVKYAMTENYSVDVQGYFKDEFDKINAADVEEEALTRQQYTNKDYGRSRGFEITLERRGGGYVNGSLSYTYAFAYGKDSKSAEEFQRDLTSREPLTESPLDNDVRHTFKSAVAISMPSTVKPRLFGVPIPNGWNLTIETVIESGYPFTPSTNYPDLAGSTTSPERNSLRLPSTAVFDVRLDKDFKLAGLDWQGILWVENLFNTRNIINVDNSSGVSETGRPDTQRNEYGVIYGGNDYDKNPYNWDYGRQIRFGVEVSI